MIHAIFIPTVQNVLYLLKKEIKLLHDIQEYDHSLLTRIDFKLTLWKCNKCHKIYKTEKGCLYHSIKCKGAQKNKET